MAVRRWISPRAGLKADETAAAHHPTARRQKMDKPEGGIERFSGKSRPAAVFCQKMDKPEGGIERRSYSYWR